MVRDLQGGARRYHHDVQVNTIQVFAENMNDYCSKNDINLSTREDFTKAFVDYLRYMDYECIPDVIFKNIRWVRALTCAYSSGSYTDLYQLVQRELQ